MDLTQPWSWTLRAFPHSGGRAGWGERRGRHPHPGPPPSRGRGRHVRPLTSGTPPVRPLPWCGAPALGGFQGGNDFTAEELD